MVKRLAEAARAAGREFGVKLSNTLEVVNHRPVFPSNEKMMYMSGRALHPLTLTLARLVDDELDGSVPISFCGGADAWNFADLVADGVTPVTVCTDLLKPGGYSRLQQYLTNLGAAMDAAGAASLDAFVEKTSGGRGRRWNLARHVERVVADGKGGRFARRERPLVFKGERAARSLRLHRGPLHGGLPRPPEHPRLPLARRARAERRGDRGDPPVERAPGRHREHLRPPVHGALRPQPLRHPARDPRDQALRVRERRLEAGSRPPRRRA